MKTCFIEIYPSKKLNRKKMIDAHLRNSVVLAKYLNADLLLIEDDFLKSLNKDYDVIILSYGARYAPFKLISEIFKRNEKAKMFWITNEYNLRPIHTICHYPHEIVANFDQQPYTKNVTDFHTLNLNLLLAKKPNKLENKKYDCIYFGTFRVNRTVYFKKYLQNDVFLSTSEKNFKKYKHLGCNPKLIKKLNWVEGIETLNLFRYSLYLEDTNTHNNFNNLANRWYEAGFCNNVMFFDKNCLPSIQKSEIGQFEGEISYYLVNSYKELQEKIKECNKDFERHLLIQQSWRKDELKLRDKMMLDLKNIFFNGQ
jgi:hypothetical protein